jgi:hypothetical protein
VPDSERALLESIAGYGKKVAIVLNKVDLLHASGGDHGADEQARVVEYVRRHASEALGIGAAGELPVLPVSARYALAAAALQSSDGVGKRSGFQQLHQYLAGSLTSSAKVKSKLSSPLGVAVHQMKACLSTLDAERSSLEVDVATIRLLQMHMEAWRSEVDRDVQTSRRDIQMALVQHGDRCHAFLRRVRWIDLVRMSWLEPPALQTEWDRIPWPVKSIADPPPTRRGVSRRGVSALRSHLLEHVRATADAIAVRGRAQGQTVIEFLGKRPSVRQNQSLVGSITAASRFEDTRNSLTLYLSEAVVRTLSSTGAEDDADSKDVLDDLQSKARLSTLVCITGIAAWTAAAVHLVDIASGISAGTALIAFGGATLSSTSWITADGYQRLWETKSRHLDKTLAAICDKELERMERRVQEGVAPYRRFIEEEQSRIERMADECSVVLRGAQDLRARIDGLRTP